MAIVLLRVDERLIHGQVVVGWGQTLHPDRIVVVDDELSDSAWEQELYLLGMPPGVDAEFDSVSTARGRLDTWRETEDRVMVLTRNLDTMARLADGDALHGAEVNLGGIHYAPGRSAVLPYLYLSDAERRVAEDLSESGIDVFARDLPGARRVRLKEILGHEPGGAE